MISPQPQGPALCVDCDGTLVQTNLMHESLLRIAKESWTSVLRLPFWLLKGKAHFKSRIADNVALDPTTLPYTEAVLELVRKAKMEGRTTVLVTAAPTKHAVAVAEHLGLFDQVLAGAP